MHAAVETVFRRQRLRRLGEVACADHGEGRLRQFFVHEAEDAHEAFGVLLIGQSADICHIIGIVRRVEAHLCLGGGEVDDIVEHGALLCKQPMERIAVKRALRHPENVPCLPCGKQIGDRLRRDAARIEIVVVNVRDQRNFAADARRIETRAHVVRVDQVRLLGAQHLADLAHRKCRQRNKADAALGKRLADLPVRAAIDHLDVRRVAQHPENLADDILRAGEAVTLQQMQYLHSALSPSKVPCGRSRQAAP